IVSIHSVGETAGIPYFAMEWIEGCSLADVIEVLSAGVPEKFTGGELTEAIARGAAAAAPAPARLRELRGSTWAESCCRLMKLVAEAIDHAHERGVIHRDVKPSNILLTATGRVVLADFGLARTDAPNRLTRVGDQLGSLPYMAPEQIRG